MKQGQGVRDLKAFIDELYNLVRQTAASGQTFGKALANANGPAAPFNTPTADGAAAVVVTTAPAVSVPAGGVLEISGTVSVTNTVGAARAMRVAVEASGLPGNVIGSAVNSTVAANANLAIPFTVLVPANQVSPNGLYTINVWTTTGGASQGDVTVQTNQVVAVVKRVD